MCVVMHSGPMIREMPISRFADGVDDRTHRGVCVLDGLGVGSVLGSELRDRNTALRIEPNHLAKCALRHGLAIGPPRYPPLVSVAGFTLAWDFAYAKNPVRDQLGAFVFS